ncbi:site-specific integrase [Desulfuromonas sp. AOP6]|uniref:site-specific integrase n=1 Tax=Desulfuromonas sp. AOP6 TaxID=1566351 RepID=UPI001BCC2B86|nr:site-specific integrase [Desulfuromonas sp. AOP6]
MKRYKWNKKTFFAIVDKFSCPVDPYASVYLNTLTHFRLSTQSRYGGELLFALKYFNSKGIDLTERAVSGKLLTMSEYTSYYEHSAKNAGHSSNEKVVPLFANSEDKSLRNILASNTFLISKVSNGTHRGRIHRLRMYLNWLFEQFHDPISVRQNIEDQLNKLTMKMIADEQSLRSKEDQQTRHPEDDAIPPEIFCKMLEVIRPISPNNPFTERNRLRNYLIVSIFLDTGIRRGALAKLKCSDLRSDQSGSSLWIYPHHDDSSDPRHERPNQKTKSHLANLKPELMDTLLFYIEHVRNEVPGALNHDFIFVSESNSRGTQGQPLAAKSINDMFLTLSKVLNHRLHPHLLRHMWNDIFDDKADYQNSTSGWIEDARKYAMGWSANSTMTDTYNDRRTHKKVRQIMQKHQDMVDAN